jgi:vitellogenic carboxypeptidase-like protein
VETEDGFVPDLPLSEYAQKQYRALSETDTVTIDPHKAGFVPYPAGSLCYRNGLLRYLITFNADYIHSKEDLNMGIFGVEGSTDH